jgi:hypothetical protein
LDRPAGATSSRIGAFRASRTSSAINLLNDSISRSPPPRHGRRIGPSPIAASRPATPPERRPPSRPDLALPLGQPHHPGASARCEHRNCTCSPSQRVIAPALAGRRQVAVGVESRGNVNGSPGRKHLPRSDGYCP